MLVLAVPAQAQQLPAASLAAADQAGAPAAPAARSQRLNPTGRSIVLTVPAKDGATYLGDMPLTIAADDALSFPAERTLQLLDELLDPAVMTALRANLSGKTSLAPSDLSDAGIGVEYDPRTLELNFLIPVEKRASRRLSVSALDRQSIGDFVRPASHSAYLNVRGSVDLYEDGPVTGFQNPIFLLNGAVNSGGLVFESDAIWTPGADGVDFQRLGTRGVYDDTKNVIRFTFGDLETQGRGFQSAPDMAGISLLRSSPVRRSTTTSAPRSMVLKQKRSCVRPVSCRST